MVIIDFGGVSVGSILGQLHRGESLSNGLVKHVILNNLRSYRVKYPEEKYGRMVVACDSHSWRTDVYPEYKALRRIKRETDSHDWNNLYDFINETIEDLKENFPYAIIKIDGAEADDIIGALSIKAAEPITGEPVVIISADKDFIQLQSLGNVIQWSPMQQKMVECDEGPERYTFNHIMKGDSSDNVPNVLSPDNTFTEQIRQTPLRKKLIDDWWEKKDNLKEAMPEEAFRNYMRNREMIDLNRMPEHIKTESVEIFETYKYKERSNILPYLIENKMKMLIENVGEF